MPDPYDLLEGDVLECLQSMPDCSIQCVVTSPPYWGLRNYGVDGAGGLESTLQEHLAWLVAVFREVRRVLRDDGVCWLNYGDAYSSNPSNQQGRAGTKSGTQRPKYATDGMAGYGRDSSRVARTGLAAKQRLLMPARVALALQDDGWWVRSEIVWAKGVSFCPTYSGSCMPSSVKDRPTDSHEMMYLLTKKPRYFYDGDSVREDAKYGRREWTDTKGNLAGVGLDGEKGGGTVKGGDPSTGRNLRTVWTINPQAMKEAHFACYPEKLVRPCILAGTSEHGACSECGAPWERVVEVEQVSLQDTNNKRSNADPHNTFGAMPRTNRKAITTGWQPTCEHPDAPVVPCKVLDPFSGSGTTGVVALRHGRHYVGCELNPDYCDMQEERLEAERWALRWADGIIFDGKRFLNGAQPITQKALRAATKKQGISGRRFRELLADARADYAQHASPPVADAGGGDA